MEALWTREWEGFGHNSLGGMQTSAGGDGGAGWEGPGLWLLMERQIGLMASTGSGHSPLPSRRKGLAAPRAGPGLWGRASILFL